MVPLPQQGSSTRSPVLPPHAAAAAQGPPNIARHVIHIIQRILNHRLFS
jgi:hypothetical protein